MFTDDTRGLEPLDRNTHELYTCERPNCPNPIEVVTPDGYLCHDCTTDTRPLLADGGTSWHDHTAIERDCLESIAHLESTAQMPSALAIARALEGHPTGEFYDALESLLDGGLVETERLGGTTIYRLSPDGARLLEIRARTLAAVCGLRVCGGEPR